MRLERILITLLIMANLYEAVREFLIMIGKIGAVGGDVRFSLFFIISAGLLFKHKFWIIAFLLDGLNAILRFFALKSFYGSDKTIFTLLIILGMLCLIASTIFFYKLLMAKGFGFREYFRFKVKGK